MPQEKDSYAHKGAIALLVPKASTDITSGDYVVMTRNSDPMSRALLAGNEGTIRPLTSAWWSQWGVGIVDADFNTNVVGATKYATPTSDEAVPIIRRGVARLAIVQTTGKAGDNIIYSSGATGAQLFTINNMRRDIGVGTIWKDFSGGSANDSQQVQLYEKPLHGRDIYFWLQNRVLQGCKATRRSLNSVASTQINAGRTGEVNMFVVKGKVVSVARKTAFVVGSLNPSSSALRFYWLAVGLSTTGVGPAWKVRTCSGKFGKFASWTVSAVSVGMMVPLTWTSNLIPAALMVGFSATQVTIPNLRLLNLDGFNLIPNGNTNTLHTKWYL